MLDQQFICSCLSWLFTLLIGLVTFLVFKHYLKARSLPPGPFSYPVIGNILEFRGRNVFFQNVFAKFAKKYKDMYTFWLGPTPAIIVTSWDRCKEALVTRRNDFSGRAYRPSAEAFTSSGAGVLTSDYGPCWETLRKIMVSAVRKYSMSEKLADLVTDVVDRSVDKIVKDGEHVEAENYAYLIVYNILASSAFGQRYEMDDPEFVALRKSSEDMVAEFMKGNPSDALPFLKWFFRKRVQKFRELFDINHGIIVRKYQENKVTYKKGEVRHFIDALLLAKEEAEEGGKEYLQYLTDQNLEMVLQDFFGALTLANAFTPNPSTKGCMAAQRLDLANGLHQGEDASPFSSKALQGSIRPIFFARETNAGTLTTKTTLLWIILVICTQLDIQEKMRNEIDEKLGDRPPKPEDRQNCPYISAVIYEALRFRPMIDMTMEHRAICDSKVGEYKIPKDTTCLFHILTSHRDETFWTEPEVFKPERFLDSEGKITSRMDGFMAFGLGPRECAGKKLALADIFFIITRLLQTATLELENGPGSVEITPEPQNFFNLPYKFNIVVKKRTSGYEQEVST